MPTPTEVLGVFSSSTESFWDYLQPLLSPFVIFGLIVAFVGIVVWLVIRAPRHVIK